ncbi:MAG: DUF58 domain-containing protein [Acidobacteriaceae bacterium]|nr:DUF58 domain-containing protein [Acidobacteriaceae bacterium]
MSTWRKIQTALQAGVNQKVTRTGLLYTLSCLLVALAAFSSANNLLFLILAAMLATLMVSGLVSRLSLAGLALDLVLPDQICARRKLLGRIIVQNEKRWMPSFSIHLAAHGNSPITKSMYMAVIPGGGRVEQPVEVYFNKRGSYRENSFRFSTRFPFGFAERRVSVLLVQDVLVYPSIDPQPGFEDLFIALQGEIQSHFRGVSGDFYRIRPYEALESSRHVDWKATAHTGDLQVREFAREQQHSLTLFLDIDVSEKESEWFERSVDCCAYLVWNLATDGTQIRFCTQRADLRLPEDGDVYTVLRYLATVSPSRGKVPPAPEERNTLQVVFSLSPERLADAGWRGQVRFVGKDLIALAEVRAD